MAIAGYPAPPRGVANNSATEHGWGSGWPACQGKKQATITLANGVTITVRSEIGELVTVLLNECLRRGYVIRDADTGGYNCRPIDGTSIPSNHSWGLAVDINWHSNPMGSATTDIPRWMVELMWAFHFYWGGWYVSPDPMHFEYVSTPTQAEKDLTVARRLYMTQPDVALTAGQDAALSQTWAANVALRDGVLTPPSQRHTGGTHWTVARIRDMDAKLTSLLTQVGALAVAVANLTELIANPPTSTVNLEPVTVVGELRFEPPTP